MRVIDGRIICTFLNLLLHDQKLPIQSNLNPKEHMTDKKYETVIILRALKDGEWNDGEGKPILNKRMNKFVGRIENSNNEELFYFEKEGLRSKLYDALLAHGAMKLDYCSEYKWFFMIPITFSDKALPESAAVLE